MIAIKHTPFSVTNIMGATCGAGTAYISGAPVFTPRILVGFMLLNL